MTAISNSSEPTAGWISELPELLDEIAGEFEIVELRNEAELRAVRQTGFAGTLREGVICLAMNRDYLLQAKDNPCTSAIIAPPPVAGALELSGKALVVCRHAEELYLYLHAEQAAPTREDMTDMDASATMDSSAILRGRVRVEAGVHIGPRAVIDGPVLLRAGAHIDAGAIVGCDGLYAKTVRGRRIRMPHFGGVEIGEQAYIHSGAVIVRSAIRGEVTRIGKMVHVGVMANVGHDAQIGDGATLSSHCVIAGRARVGDGAWIGASATVSNEVRVGEHARVRLGAVVIRDVPAGTSVSGNFAMDHARKLRNYLKEEKS